ncbi:MAG: penicillin-binding transpeptidase domain-containing protein [Chloroflexota bacterium]
MKKAFAFAFILILLVGCHKTTTETPVAETGTPTPLATIAIQTTQTPSVERTAKTFLDAWQAEDYPAMYALLDSESQMQISQSEFSELYNQVAVELALEDIEYEILSTYIEPQSAQVAFEVGYNSVLIEGLQREIIMDLSLHEGEWKINWSKTLIFPELQGENSLLMYRQVPVRGNIYDRDGSVIVAPAKAISLGLSPAQIDPKREEDMLKELGRALDMEPEAIKAQYADYAQGWQGFVPLGAVAVDKEGLRRGALGSYIDNGLMLREFEGRYYFDGGVSPQAIGYVRWIQKEEKDYYKRLGYSVDEKVGAQGIEKWGEPYLSGERGGTLYIEDAEGEIVTRLASSEAKPADEIYTTLDKEFQLEVQDALFGFSGAIVVLEIDTGRVLAMASNPSFDPNAFNSDNFNSSYQLQDYYQANRKSPFLNRATQGLYPLGSVFKIITMSAALESGEYTADTTYDCGYHFDELDGVRLHDWTWEHYQEELAEGDDDPQQPSGTLDLVGGLMRSCNPYFWHIGLDLYNKGMTEAVSDMAKGFGLGSLTGIEFLEEEAGNIPIPQSEVDATNLAIGQGNTQVTPLQVARFIAALGNGGTLYRPQIVESIRTPAGEEIYSFEPEADGELPISDSTLSTVTQAMRDVVYNSRGTAYHRFGGIRDQVPLVGKTGTAESGSGEAHAWFAGYTAAENEDKPDIAIVVIAENAGEGSEVAAPIFRRVVEQYFNQYLRLYPWESEIGVWEAWKPTPTPKPKKEG